MTSIAVLRLLRTFFLGGFPPGLRYVHEASILRLSIYYEQFFVHFLPYRLNLIISTKNVLNKEGSLRYKKINFSFFKKRNIHPNIFIYPIQMSLHNLVFAPKAKSNIFRLGVIAFLYLPDFALLLGN